MTSAAGNTRTGATRSGWVGSKASAGIAELIIRQMPPHSLYVEPFLGGGALLRKKRPAACSIALDVDTRSTERAARCRIPGVTVITGDALEWLDKFEPPPGTLIYADPPYPMQSRASTQPRYAQELTKVQHRRLLRCLTSLPCAVMISTYPNRLYSWHLHDWRCVEFIGRTRGNNRPTEQLWCNFPEPATPHDLRYLGRTFRERERLKRKAARWRARLRMMPEGERAVLLSVAAEFCHTDLASPNLLRPPAAGGSNRLA